MVRPRRFKRRQTGTRTHDANGKFAKGNPGGPGNPHMRKIQLWRDAFAKAVTVKDFQAVVKVLVAKALEGEGWAVKEVLDRALGKAVQPVGITSDDGERVPVRITFEMPKGDQ